MPLSDHELPVTDSFIELVESAKTNELSQIEEQRKREKDTAKAFREANKIMNTSDLFYTDREEEDAKKKKTILNAMDKLNRDTAAAATAAKEKANATEEEFPPPPIL